VHFAFIIIISGADLNSTDNTGKTAILTGLCEGNEKLCCLLIRNGCDVNIVDSHGHIENSATLLKTGYELKTQEPY
jgi:ankyrin repeat protein